MNRSFVLSILCVFFLTFVFGHEGHKDMEKQETIQESVDSTQVAPTTEPFGRPQNWKQWVGGFHFIILHFPIALINMTVISELLFGYYSKPIFDFSSKFMLITAAITGIPTAL